MAYTASAIETAASYSEGTIMAFYFSSGQVTSNKPSTLPSSYIPGESVWTESVWNGEGFDVRSDLNAILLSLIESGTSISGRIGILKVTSFSFISCQNYP